MNEEQGTFKVTDRRLFNADGTPRELTPEEKQEAATVSTPVLETKPNANQVENQPPRAEQHQKATMPPTSSLGDDNEEDLDTPDARDPASFINFTMSIASNAASALGMIEHPVTHQSEVDVELAKHWIDVLGMLHQKTRGNLTAQEQQILEGLLSDLRMQYVSLAGSPPAKAAKPLSGRDIIGGK
ncbi:MAG TPA: DUF1844 domain-containing protein [Pyrinomonadaceae bacterium]